MEGLVMVCYEKNYAKHFTYVIYFEKIIWIIDALMMILTDALEWVKKPVFNKVYFKFVFIHL